MITKKTPGNALGRMEYMRDLLQETDLNNTIDFETKIKGTTIKKLCEFSGGGYFRVIKWLESKVLSDPNILSEEMESARKEFTTCFELMKSRNVKYGDSWKVLSIPSLANLCEMKLHRISNMDTKNLDPKIEDELRDTANYMIFALMKLNTKI